MIVLIDTNVLLDFLLSRELHSSNADRIYIDSYTEITAFWEKFYRGILVDEYKMIMTIELKKRESRLSVICQKLWKWKYITANWKTYVRL